MFYEIEDTPENGECLEQLIEYNHCWYWHRCLYGYTIASQLHQKIMHLKSGTSLMDVIESSEITIDEVRLINDMITQYDILNHEGDYK